MHASIQNELESLREQVKTLPHGRVPAVLRRAQILAEAHALFVEKGYQGAAMDELAHRVGVSKPVIYNLIGNKDEVFHEVMTRVGAELAEAVITSVAAAEGRPERLYAGILAFFRFIEPRRAAFTALLSTEAGPHTAEAHALRAQQIELIAGLIASEDELDADPPLVHALGHAVNGAVEAVGLWWHEHPEYTPDQLATLLTRLLGPGLIGFGKTVSR